MALEDKMKGVPYMDKAHPLMVLKGDNCIVCVIHAAADPRQCSAELQAGLFSFFFFSRSSVFLSQYFSMNRENSYQTGNEAPLHFMRKRRKKNREQEGKEKSPS